MAMYSTELLIKNLPTQIRNSRRFDKGQMVGFDTGGHGIAPDYLLIDADNVLDAETGEFINEAARAWFDDFVNWFPYAYIEKSISERGLHIFLILTAGKFPSITNAKKKVILFDKETDCKVELFYLSGGRYCLLTGISFFDNPFICCEVPEGESADAYLNHLMETYNLKIFLQVVNSDSVASDNIITISEEYSQNLICIERRDFFPQKTSFV